MLELELVNPVIDGEASLDRWGAQENAEQDGSNPEWLGGENATQGP
jgi:hypothetical protein